MAHINKEKCIPCGLCFGSYPGVFKQWADGKAEVIDDGNLTDEQQKTYDEVKPMCPVSAIE